ARFWRAVEGATSSLTLIIRTEGIRQLSVLGIRTADEGEEVRPKGGRKSVLRHFPVNSEAHTKLTL
ncbi:hypothetical protein NIES593_17420, partial [Hydrococcus rivularis NIES-593]